jgi:hypothetical protein
VASKKKENSQRRKALKDLASNGPKKFNKGYCRNLGDAFFAQMCPQNANIVTTNISDFIPLCSALKKQAVKP